MSVAYSGLLALIAATPVLLFFDNVVSAGGLEFLAAIGMALIALAMRPGEARHLIKLLRIPLVLAALPLAWMLIQLAPVPLGGISQSLWRSTATALAVSLLPGPSIDPGLTLLAFCRLASLAAVTFVAMAVAIERTRAKQVLFVLALAATTMASISFVDELGGARLLDRSVASELRPAFLAAAVLGDVFLAAIVIMVIEQYELRDHPGEFFKQLVLPLAVVDVAFLICSSSLVAAHAGYAAFAAACGCATVGVIYGLRRIGFGPPVALIVGAVAIAAAAAIISAKTQPLAADLSLRYAATADPEIVSLDDRILNEVGLGGSGAGTLQAIRNLFGAPSFVAPVTSFAAQIAIELGRPLLWLVVALTCLLVVLCARGAFNRGRDVFYPLAGAGAAVSMLLASFAAAGVANAAISMLVAIALGLALAQTVSRSA